MEEKKSLKMLKSDSLVDNREPARCTGQCCHKFTMSASFERIQQMYKDWVEFGGGMSRIPMNDVHIVALMLIPLGEQTHDIDGHAFEGGPRMMFTCKHFDKEKGNCTIYEHRPQMCREYPYRNSCRYEGCTYVAEPRKPDDIVKEMMLPSAPELSPAAELSEKCDVMTEGPVGEAFAPKALKDMLDKYELKLPPSHEELEAKYADEKYVGEEQCEDAMPEGD